MLCAANRTASFQSVETYLDKIVAWHRDRAQRDGLHDAGVLAGLQKDATDYRVRHDTRGFRDALQRPGLSVIAEIKRRSPSRGLLVADLDPELVAKQYEFGGAAALSVLTDSAHFGGSAQDLRTARSAVALPVIRKDFTVCEADVLQAVLMGADCVLLIVAVLSDEELQRCSAVATQFNLDVLWETHDETEVERILPYNPRVIGVNQRDLHTFTVDQERAVRVAASIPAHIVKVAESGVRGPDDVAVLRAAGYDAVLVGESIVTSANRSDSVRSLILGAQTAADVGKGSK
jgi:indole-3-glycerol phosphate synthase